MYRIKTALTGIIRRKWRMTLTVYLLVHLAISTVKADELYPMFDELGLQRALRKAAQYPPGPEKLHLYINIGQDYIARAVHQPKLLDSCLFFLNKARAINKVINYKPGDLETRIFSGVYQCLKDQSMSGQPEINQAVTEAQKLGLIKQEGIGWYMLGAFSPPVERLRFYHRSLLCFEKAGEKYETAYLYKSLSEIYFREPGVIDREKGLSLALKALNILQSIKNTDLQYIYYRLTDFYYRLFRYPETIKYGLLGIDATNKSWDTEETTDDLYYMVADAYRLTKNYPMSDQYYASALKIAGEYRSVGLIHHIAMVNGESYLSRGNPEKALAFYLNTVKDYPPGNSRNKLIAAQFLTRCYIKLKKYDLAEKHGQEMIALDEAIDKVDSTHVRFSYHTNTMFQAGLLYFEKKDLSRARHYFEKFLAEDQVNNVASRSSIEMYLFKLDSLEGDFKSAMGHYQKYKAHTDSMLNIAKSQQIIDYQTQYGVKEKELQLQLKEENIKFLNERNRVQQQNANIQQGKLTQANLLAQKNQAELKLKEKGINILNQQTVLQQASIKNKELQRNIIIGAAAALSLLSGLLFMLFRNKQTTNKNLKSQQAQITRANNSLTQLVEEKEWLLKEVHHRVKNNLQMVISLLESQSAYLHSDALEAMQKSQNRIYAISLIHQKLYQSEELKSIDMSCFIPELISYLRECFDVGNRIRFTLDIHPVEFDVAEAVPVGLIINEVVTNSLKYAFKGRYEGEVTIRLEEDNGKNYELTISDNGVGIPDGFDCADSSSMGIKLIRGLARQIDAELVIKNDQGAVFILTFVYAEKLEAFSSAVDEV